MRFHSTYLRCRAADQRIAHDQSHDPDTRPERHNAPQQNTLPLLSAKQWLFAEQDQQHNRRQYINHWIIAKGHPKIQPQQCESGSRQSASRARYAGEMLHRTAPSQQGGRHKRCCCQCQQHQQAVYSLFHLALIGFAELKEFIIGAFLIQHTLFTDFNDARCNGLHKLMVMRRKQNRTLEITHTVVDRRNGFQI